jgi:ABC-type amino acid transport substrate-binding protein
MSGAASDASGSTLDGILERGEIRLAVEFLDPEATGFPPEMFLDPESGTAGGVGPELVTLMAQDLGVEAVFVDSPWPTHRELLMDGKVDLILGTNTPNRALTVDFLPGRLMQNRVNCLVRKGSGRTLEMFDQGGMKIAVWHGSSVGDVARRFFPNATVVESSEPTALLLQGEADAYAIDSVTHRLLEILGDFEFLRDGSKPVVLSTEHVHFGFRPGDPRFMNWLVNWYDYHDAQGTIRHWCHDYWEASIAD